MDIEQLEQAEDEAWEDLDRVERRCCKIAKKLLKADKRLRKSDYEDNEAREERDDWFEDLYDALGTRLCKADDWYEAEEKLALARQPDLFNAGTQHASSGV